MSLRILKGLPLQDFPGAHIGIMAHANTTANFQLAYRDYPCEKRDHCDAVDGPCQFPETTEQCPVREHILARTIKMCDSGMFTREGVTLTYPQLFETYARMGVRYGIMIDVFCNAAATIASAREALRFYEPHRQTFNLVAVAQGTNVDEYLNCYAQLRGLGFEHIAVGGLLRRRVNTVRIANVHDEQFMFQVMRELRQRYPNDWLFALGTFHPNRLARLQELAVWADYKGWIFQYQTRNDTLNTLLTKFAANHLEHIDEAYLVFLDRQVATLPDLVLQRDAEVGKFDLLSQQLIEGRRRLRTALSALHTDLAAENFPQAPHIATLATHGLQDDVEERRVVEAMRAVGRFEQEIEGVLSNIQENRQIRASIKSAEMTLDAFNAAIKKSIDAVLTNAAALPKVLQEYCATIVELIQVSERDYRFRQVRAKIAKSILPYLSGGQQMIRTDESGG
jgi:hypothetical protein